MSDVEKICQINHERVRWAEQYADIELEFVDDEKEKHAMEKYKILKFATFMSAGLTGVGVTFLCAGLRTMQISSIVVGFIVTAVFSVFGCCMDIMTEEELDHVWET